jgi:hypothetical protein
MEYCIGPVGYIIIMKLLILFIAAVWLTYSKVVSAAFPVQRLLNDDNFMYLAKMDFGIGQSTAKILFKYLSHHKG